MKYQYNTVCLWLVLALIHNHIIISLSFCLLNYYLRSTLCYFFFSRLFNCFQSGACTHTWNMAVKRIRTMTWGETLIQDVAMLDHLRILDDILSDDDPLTAENWPLEVIEAVTNMFTSWHARGETSTVTGPSSPGPTSIFGISILTSSLEPCANLHLEPLLHSPRS